jgi:2',3'-cyclic-nucleotide 2'-phosphodiesterase (5'-nucleotidase family)
VVVAGMSLMGYDAMALGPKELSLGPDVLRQRMEEASFAMLSANVVMTGTQELLAPPYVVLEVGDRRVGILGLTRQTNEVHPSFQVLDPYQAVVRYLSELSEQVNVVVLLTNLPYRAALALVGGVPGVNVAIAALPGQLPSQVVEAPHTRTMVVTAEQPVRRHAGRRVGRLVVTLQGDGILSTESWDTVPMGPEIRDDLDMQKLLDEYRP